LHILFYIDPLIERDSPLWKRGWLSSFVLPIISGLLKEGSVDEDFACVVPTSLITQAKEALPLKVRIEAIDQLEMIPKFGRSALEISNNWYSEEYDSRSLEAMTNLIKKRLTRFSPDICISFSPSPFLSKAWPKSKVLNLEYGFISRSPFPETVYFDPRGMYQSSVLACYQSEIKSFAPSSSDLNLVKQIRNDFCGPQNNSNESLERVASKFSTEFESAVLLALQFSNYYAYDSHAYFQSQYDLLIHVLSKVPKNIAVIVCEHPEHLILEDETVKYLRSKYPNFIWNPLFREIHGASLQLLNYVKAVITVSSSLGLQSLLFKRPLIVIGESHLNLIADSHTLSDLPILLDKKWPKWKEKVLAWLLNHYCIPLEMLCNSGNLSSYLKAHTNSFYEISARLDQSKVAHSELFNAYKKAFYNKPFSPYRSINQEFQGPVIPRLYMKLGGDEYTESLCLRNFNFVNGDTAGIINFPLICNGVWPISVRFDPSDYPGLFLLSDFSLCNSRGEKLWEWGGDARLVSKSSNVLLMKPVSGIGILLLCYGNDPFIEFTIDLNLQNKETENLKFLGLFQVSPNALVEHTVEEIGRLQTEAAKRDIATAELHQIAVERQEEIGRLQTEAAKRDIATAELHQIAVERQEEIGRLQTEAAKRDIATAELHQIAVERQEEIGRLQTEAAKRDIATAELHQIAVERQEEIGRLQTEAAKRDIATAELHQIAVERQEEIGRLQTEAAKRDIATAELHQIAVERQEEIGRLQTEAAKRDIATAELHQIAVERQEEIGRLQTEAAKRDIATAELHQIAVERQEEIGRLQTEAAKRDIATAELHERIEKIESTIWWKLYNLIYKKLI
jgi:hypothetical protein